MENGFNSNISIFNKGEARFKSITVKIAFGPYLSTCLMKVDPILTKPKYEEYLSRNYSLSME